MDRQPQGDNPLGILLVDCDDRFYVSDTHG
jgi:hypothetical protein